MHINVHCFSSTRFLFKLRSNIVLVQNYLIDTNVIDLAAIVDHTIHRLVAIMWLSFN